MLGFAHHLHSLGGQNCLGRFEVTCKRLSEEEGVHIWVWAGQGHGVGSSEDVSGSVQEEGHSWNWLSEKLQILRCGWPFCC